MPADTADTLILNVDDTDATKHLRTTLLRAAGFEVLEAATGPEALSLAASRRPSLVLLDISLPGGLDGIEVCRQLRASPSTASTAVIHISAVESIVRGLEAGSDMYLTEPVDPDVLIRVVRAVLRRKRAKDEARSALLRSEDLYHALVDNAVFGIYETSLDGVVLAANPAMARMVGQKSADDLIGVNITTLYVDPATRARIVSHFLRDEFVGIEADWQKADHTPIRVRLSGRRFDGPHGSVYHVIAEDVSERHRLESDLQQAQKMEAIGRLAGGIAHDFNNMLTAILGFSDMLLEQLSNQPIGRDLLEIKRAAERAAALTRRLLAFSRKQVMRMEVLDLNELLGTMDQLCRRIIGEDVTLVVVPSTQVGHINADRSQVEQIVMNLVVNARDAMPNGGTLTLGASLLDVDAAAAAHRPPLTPGQYMLLTVSDTGVGMTEAVKQRLFEPFFTTKESGKGTGLGLATTYGIVKQLGGFIWADSEQNKGATFRIYFPTTSPPAHVAPREVAETRAIVGRGTILLVEDEEAVRRFTALSLKRHGYVVFDLSGPNEALAWLASWPTPLDLMITDVVMPGLSGPALADRARRQQPDLPVLFISGHAEQTLAHQGVLNRGINLLEKPYTSSALLSRVRETLERHDEVM